MAGMIRMHNGVTNVTYKVLKPKLFPNKKIPKTNNGTEIHKVMISTGRPVNVEKMIHSPVIPPGARPVNWKKKFTAIAVNTQENVIHKISTNNSFLFINKSFQKKNSHIESSFYSKLNFAAASSIALRHF